MSLHFFFLPAVRPRAAQDELNLFLAQQRVLTLAREFVTDGANSGWAVCVEVAPGPPELLAALRASPRRGSVDYKLVLPPAEFEFFAALRDLRKQLAQADCAPVHAVFSNEQLAEMARRRPTKGEPGLPSCPELEGRKAPPHLDGAARCRRAAWDQALPAARWCARVPPANRQNPGALVGPGAGGRRPNAPRVFVVLP